MQVRRTGNLVHARGVLRGSAILSPAHRPNRAFRVISPDAHDARVLRVVNIQPSGRVDISESAASVIVDGLAWAVEADDGWQEVG